MKKLITLSAIISLISCAVNAQTIVLTDTEKGIEQGNWQTDSQKLNITGQASAYSNRCCTAENRKAPR